MRRGSKQLFKYVSNINIKVNEDEIVCSIKVDRWETALSALAKMSIKYFRTM